MTTSPSEDDGAINVTGMIQLPKESLPFLQKIFGPAAEVGELLSERIRYFRWKSSLKTMKRAEELANEYGIEPKEIPYKTLVPLIEKSSLEDEDSPLIERWANLLASAASGNNGREPAFVDILSTLTKDEVVLLESLVPRQLKGEIVRQIDGFSEFDLQNQKVFGRILLTLESARRARLLNKITAEISEIESPLNNDSLQRDLDDIVYRFSEYSDTAITIEFIEYDGINDDDKISSFSHSELYGSNSDSFDILIAKGLLYRHIYNGPTLRGRLTLSALHPTPLGVAFVSACRGDDLASQGHSL